MNLNQLKTLVLLAENGSFSQTAQRQGLSQPAVSFQIQSLEEHFGVSLIQRSTKGAELTPAGRAVFEFARKTLAELGVLERELRDLSQAVQGELFLGASTIPGEYLLPYLMRDFKTLFPGARLSLRIADSRQVIQWLIDKEIDFGVVGAFLQHPQIEIAVRWTDQLQVIVPVDHPWASRRSVAIRELSSVPLILREAGSGTRMVVEDRLREKGIKVSDLNVVMELGSTAATLTAVEAGLGITVVSTLAAAKALELGRVMAVNVKDLDLTRELFLIHLKQASFSRVAAEFNKFAAAYRIYPGGSVLPAGSAMQYPKKRKTAVAPLIAPLLKAAVEEQKGKKPTFSRISAGLTDTYPRGGNKTKDKSDEDGSAQKEGGGGENGGKTTLD